MKTKRTLTADEELWNTIDAKRGDIPRSTFCAKLMSESIKVNKN